MRKVRLVEGQRENKLEFYLVLCKHCDNVEWWGRKQPYLVETKRRYKTRGKDSRTGLPVVMRYCPRIVLGQRGGYRCSKCRSIQGVLLDPMKYAIWVQWGGGLIRRVHRQAKRR